MRRPARVFAYSYDGMGLGHLRRNLRLLGAIGDACPGAAMLTVTGSAASGLFDLPHGVDVLRLPGMTKSATGASTPSRLPIAAAEVRAVRSAAMAGAVEAFRPDLLLVDFYPLGRDGELAAALAAARRVNPSCRAVIGMRDVVDAPAAVDREWRASGHLAAIEEHYDRVLVYGDEGVYDAPTEYAYPAAVVARTRFTGYLADVSAAPVEAAEIVCTMGGGSDAAGLARVFLDAMRDVPERSGLLVTGPFMAERDAVSLTASAPANTRVERFRADLPGVLCGARVVVTMAGYNTSCELLAAGVPAIVVPRTVPRAEQLIRAERLAPLTGWDVIEPAALTATLLSHHVIEALDRPRRRPAIALAGVATTARIVAELLASAPATMRAAG